MQIQYKNYPLAVSLQLVNILTAEIDQSGVDGSKGCILNFRDPNYSADSGGYHPVEIMINKEARLQYITDFAYYGYGAHAELSKELDFDFSQGLFQHMGREYPIRQGAGLYRVWQANFCSHYQRSVFKVSVSSLE